MDEAADVAPENGRRGRAAGTRNYRNDLLIPIVEGILPQGAEGWRLVAASYKTASGEPDLRDHEALRENWVKKLCNNFKKPTGRTGENGDRIARCIEIERRIQEAANAAILGVSSAESEHEDEDEDDDIEAIGGSLRARRPRAGEARGRGGVRAAHLCRCRDVRSLLSPLGRAFVRAAVGVRQRQSPLVLRRGIEDPGLRDRGAARLGDA